jgi:rare lipoprotein A
LAFGTNVLVTNVRNGKTVVVRITDRGPFGRGRIIDVTRAAARELDMIDSGTAKVTLVRQ